MSNNISHESVCFAHWLVKTGREERTPEAVLVDVTKKMPEIVRDAITKSVEAGYLATDKNKRFTWLTDAGTDLITKTKDVIRT